MGDTKHTYIEYPLLKQAATNIKKIRTNINDIKINRKGFKLKLTKDSFPTIEKAQKYCKEKLDWNIKIHPDIIGMCGDKDFYWKMEWGKDRTEVINSNDLGVPLEFELDNGEKATLYSRDILGDYLTPKSEYFIPSLEEVIGNYKDEKKLRQPLSSQTDTLYISKMLTEFAHAVSFYGRLNNIVKNYNKAVDQVYSGLLSEEKYILNIYEAYQALEKSAQAKFIGKKTGKKYSKTEIAKKYSSLVVAAGSKNAKKYLRKILKDTKSKVSESTVLSIYKKWKKNNRTTSGNVSVKQEPKPKKSGNSGNVVQNGNQKSSNKSLAKTAAKKSGTKNVLVGATVLAATRKGIKTDIKQVNSNANTRIMNAKTVSADKKRKLEIERNEKLEVINKKAAEEIEAVDINDENAQEKIDQIKANAEREVDAVNSQYNNDIAVVDKELDNQVSTIKSSGDKEVKNLNQQLGKLKSTKQGSGVVEQRVAKSASKGVDSVDPKISNSDVTTSHENMMNATIDMSDVYEEKSAAIKEVVDSATGAQPTEPPVTDTTINNNPNASVTIEESVASPVPTPTETIEKEPTTVTYEPSTSNDSYVTNDGPREGIVPDSSSTPTAPTKDTGIDQSNTSSGMEASIENNNSNLKEKGEEVVSITGGDTESSNKKSSSGFSTAIPIGLGVAATGAAAVAGIRYVKNRKQNEDIDETYDDENNNLEDESGYEEIPSDSAYMRDDYLGPEGSSYTEIPDENSYTDTEELEEAAGIGGFSEDAALSDLN